MMLHNKINFQVAAILFSRDILALNVNIFFSMMQSIEILCMSMLHTFNLNTPMSSSTSTSFLPNKKMWNKQQAKNTSKTIVMCSFVFFRSYIKVCFNMSNAFSTIDLPFFCLQLYNNSKIE